ncbi:hypothetical protein IPJ72_02990 [Candidatus Peregrinibacteria bacterium]|nr:MAG: hypothetical protein IPJ72_02990 [Candidatus Peregrinibacteria bacterium]
MLRLEKLIFGLVASCLLIFLIPSFAFAACGDGALDGAETCDDSNTNGGDGCSAVCLIETTGLSITPSTILPNAGTGVNPGDILIYAILMTNTGQQNLTNVELTVLIDPQSVYFGFFRLPCTRVAFLLTALVIWQRGGNQFYLWGAIEPFFYRR